MGSEGGDKGMVGNEGGGMEWMLTGNAKRQQHYCRHCRPLSVCIACLRCR